MALVKNMTMDELRAMVAPAESLERQTFDPRATGQFVQSNGRVAFELDENQLFDVTQDAYLRLGQMLGIPAAYAKKMPPNMMLPHFNYWLANRGFRHLTMAANNNVVKLFSKGVLAPVSNDFILDVIRDEIGDQLQVYHVSHDLFQTNFSVVQADLQYDIGAQVGDPVRYGVAVENSYANTTPLTISAYVHRLSCTNGAISADTVYSLSRKSGGPGGEDGGVEEWVQQAIEGAFAQADLAISRLHNLQSIELSAHISDTLQGIYSEFGVPVHSRDEITNMVVDLHIDSLYDLYNVITDVASNSELAMENPAMAMRLMRIGGRIAAHPEICGQCHRPYIN